MNFYPIASNLPPSMILNLASSYYFDSCILGSASFFSITAYSFLPLWFEVPFFTFVLLLSFWSVFDIIFEFILISYALSLWAYVRFFTASSSASNTTFLVSILRIISFTASTSFNSHFFFNWSKSQNCSTTLSSPKIFEWSNEVASDSIEFWDVFCEASLAKLWDTDLFTTLKITYILVIIFGRRSLVFSFALVFSLLTECRTHS